jgi:hypothetical protein
MRAGIATVAALAASACLAMPEAAVADDSVVVDFVLEQLACKKDPDALPAITYLAKRRMIDLKDNVGGDSVSCYALRKPLDLGGLEVTGVCGATEEAIKHVLWPDVFYRGPGTSPGTLLSVSTPAPASKVAAWAASEDIAAAVGESDWFAGQTEVECNSMTRG